MIIAAGNLAWVVAAAVLLIGFPDAVSGAGKWIIGMFSAVVLAFGAAQSAGLRQLR